MAETKSKEIEHRGMVHNMNGMVEDIGCFLEVLRTFSKEGDKIKCEKDSALGRAEAAEARIAELEEEIDDLNATVKALLAATGPWMKKS